MRRLFPIAALVAAVSGAGFLWAHEGHEHRIMGKVVAIDATRIEVASTDGRQVTGALSAETKYLRGRVAAARTDVKVGERVVVVVVEGKDKMPNVKQVLLGPSSASTNTDRP